MRNLVIKREKSFVGCLTKVRVYVHDELTGDTKINGDKCYKLGELKNGEEEVFVIGDGETKIYMIQDKISRNICNEVCFIPAGVDDVFLMGECKYNPFSGNQFRFHGMTDPRVLANRKKSVKRFCLFLAICMLIGFVGGFLGTYDPPVYAKDGAPVEFVDESGVTMTLTDSFEKIDAGFTFTYSTSDVAVFGNKEKFTLMDGFEDYSLKEYGELSIRVNELDSELKKENGITYYTYKGYVDSEGIDYCYLAAIYKTEDAFWTITFAVEEANYEEYKPLFLEWAKDIQFVEE